MAVDILELAEFYAGLDGARARVQIVEKIDALWPDPQAELPPLEAPANIDTDLDSHRANYRPDRRCSGAPQ